jgi:hypothetical protein
MSAALTRGTRGGGGRSAALLLRADSFGAIFYKVASGLDAASHDNVSEPLRFCPFCGACAARTAAHLSARGPAVTTRLDDEELTHLADVTRVRAAAPRVGAVTVAM